MSGATSCLVLLGRLAILATCLAATGAKGWTCESCEKESRECIEQFAGEYSRTYTHSCKQQGPQGCIRAAEKTCAQFKPKACSGACDSRPRTGAIPDEAAEGRCRGEIQDELNRLTGERQKCYGAVVANPANFISCKEIDSRIDLLKLQRDNCYMNPEQGTLSASRSRQTNSNILPPPPKNRSGGSGSAQASSSSNSGRVSSAEREAHQRYPASDLSRCIRLVNENGSSFIQNDCDEKLWVQFRPISGIGAGMSSPSSTTVAAGGRSSTNRTSGITEVSACRYPDTLNSGSGYCTVAGQ